MTLKLGISALIWTFFLATGTSNAATFVVNETIDNVDDNPGDGFCAVPFTGNCSLRAAVQEANALSGADTILLGPGTFTLTREGVGEDAAVTGDLDLLDAVTIIGAGRASTIISGGFIDRVFDVIAAGANVSLYDLEVRYGATNHVGGGIRHEGSLSLLLSGVSIFGNLALNGAGLNNIGTAYLIDSEVAYNFTTSSGCGGGIKNIGGYLAVLGSSIHHNGAGTGSTGGGICNFGLPEGPTGLFIQRSTVSDNAPDGLAGINVSGNTWIFIEGSTIADNDLFGIRTVSNGTPPEISCSIVSGHSTADCSSETLPPITSGFTLSQDGSCSDVQTDLIGDPLLGPLVSGGGRPLARAPYAGSPAIDGGSNSLCPGTDQWGRPRTMDGDQNGTPIADIGALEAVMLFADGFESGDATAWSQVSP